jgi:hypothetical protein
MEAQLPLARRTELAWRRTQPTAPRQDLVLDDVRLRAMTPAERLAALRAIALLLLEAVGVAMREAGDDKMTTHDALIPTVVLQRKAVVCESAWNKDPVFGVIGIQSGPRG